MSKRNVAFIKPEEPNFLKRIKQQIGYKEPDTIETKRAAVDNFSDDEEDYQEKDDEKPLVVQIKEGDLTEEEAARLAKEESEKPADLNQRIVFKRKKKDEVDESSKDVDGSSTEKHKNSKKVKEKRQKPVKNLLSFEDDNDDDEG
ncbi:CLUMA_CG015742, isoform A [Clunio marinus]|uniref:CLUMA_CG015742, isoform A n=1 Tax=Clunio marinus TaxID=568069 RepID=A0A1J1IT67_9DIPT|nr:CLUMA_CG015742, isoform A [Clunio marinus]